MRWEDQKTSANVEDRRGQRTKQVVGGGIGALILALVISLLTRNPEPLLKQLAISGATWAQGQEQREPTPAENEQARFVGVVLQQTEDVWGEVFQRNGLTYREPKLILFSGRVSSACGLASAAMGPFYCPADSNAYLDLSFFTDLERKFGAKGDFARAYVVAHEIGHHVQNLLGTSDQVAKARGRVSQTEYNRLSVRLELQADFLAGVWAHHAQRKNRILEEGDIAEAINAANAIGDDRLQRQAQGTVVPDSFTHGSSAQRVAWFKYGFETGDPSKGDTFDEAVFARVNPR